MSDQWIEIFRAGTRPDISGRTVTISASDLAGTVRVYNPNLHEAPIWVNHKPAPTPTGNLGYWEAIKLDGQVLLGKPRATSSSFLDPDGSPPQISASFYAPDSASNPIPGFYYFKEASAVDIAAVKGMARRFSFGETEEGVLTFCDWMLDDTFATVLLNIREYLIDKDGMDVADRIVPMTAIESMMQSIQRQRSEENAQLKAELEADQSVVQQITGYMENENTQVSAETPIEETAAPVQPEVKTPEPEPTAIEAGEPKVTPFSEAAFSEQMAAFAEREAALKAQEAELKAREAAIERQQFTSFAEGLLNSGRQFDLNLAVEIYGGSDTVSFSEDGQTVERDRAEAFKTFLERLPKVVNFAEVAPAAEVVEFMDKPYDAAAMAQKYIEKMAKQGKKISVTAAMKALKENPKLAQGL